MKVSYLEQFARELEVSVYSIIFSLAMNLLGLNCRISEINSWLFANNTV
jgi:hypothetical protein